jgi:NADH:ubiquinone oxidoreductase subunit K
MIPLSWFLLVATALFCIGLFGVLARKNAVGILMSLELMLNGINILVLSFWSYLYAPMMNGLVFVTIIFVAAAAETAVGLGLIISAYRRRATIVADDLTLLQG